MSSFRLVVREVLHDIHHGLSTGFSHFNLPTCGSLQGWVGPLPYIVCMIGIEPYTNSYVHCRRLCNRI